MTTRPAIVAQGHWDLTHPTLVGTCRISISYDGKRFHALHRLNDQQGRPPGQATRRHFVKEWNFRQWLAAEFDGLKRDGWSLHSAHGMAVGTPLCHSQGPVEDGAWLLNAHPVIAGKWALEIEEGRAEAPFVAGLIFAGDRANWHNQQGFFVGRDDAIAWLKDKLRDFLRNRWTVGKVEGSAARFNITSRLYDLAEPARGTRTFI